MDITTLASPVKKTTRKGMRKTKTGQTSIFRLDADNFLDVLKEVC
jgi:hypothetical protein